MHLGTVVERYGVQYLLITNFVFYFSWGMYLYLIFNDSNTRKQEDPYPIPTRTQHFYQPVPYTNSYHIPNTCNGL